jgi:NTE family protein
LSAPVFNPIPESKALFLPNFRAHQFGAFGILNIIKLPKNFDWRIEGYVFQPYQRIIENEFLDASYNPPLVNRFYIASTGLVFNSPIGPAAIMLNYYNNDPKFNSKIDKYSIIFTFGYIIHNKKMFD